MMARISRLPRRSARATAHAAEGISTCAGIALFTESGTTARQLSKYHPAAPIFALSAIDVTIHRLNLLWGTIPVRCTKATSTEEMVDMSERLLQEGGYVRPSEVIAIVAGTPDQVGLNELHAPACDGRGRD